MGRSHHPIRTTIFFGLICGLAFIPLNLALTDMLPGSNLNYLILWMYAAGYSLLLSRWSKSSILSIGFPLLLLLATSFLVESIAAFYILTLVIISWIRSGICFRNPGALNLMVELLFCAFGGFLMVLFTPASDFAWMPGIWMFFLIQSLYFVIFENETIKPDDPYDIDPFERASRQAETILSDL